MPCRCLRSARAETRCTFHVPPPLKRTAFQGELPGGFGFGFVGARVELWGVVFALEIGGEGGVGVEGAFIPVGAVELAELGAFEGELGTDLS